MGSALGATAAPTPWGERGQRGRHGDPAQGKARGAPWHAAVSRGAVGPQPQKPSLGPGGGRPAWLWGAGGRGRAGAGPCLRHPARSPNTPDLKRRFPAGRCGRAVAPHRRDSPHPDPPLPDPPPRTGGTERGGRGTRPSGAAVAAQQSRVVCALPPPPHTPLPAAWAQHSCSAAPAPLGAPRAALGAGCGAAFSPWARPVLDVGTRWGSWPRADAGITLRWELGVHIPARPASLGPSPRAGAAQEAHRKPIGSFWEQITVSSRSRSISCGRIPRGRWDGRPRLTSPTPPPLHPCVADVRLSVRPHSVPTQCIQPSIQLSPNSSSPTAPTAPPVPSLCPCPSVPPYAPSFTALPPSPCMVSVCPSMPSPP